jgi:Ras GTPase-activating-like protein IQGAP2/3
VLTPGRAPETFDIVQNTIGPLQRKNLFAISRLLTQIASGAPFDNVEIALVPLNDYVSLAIDIMSKWFLEGQFWLIMNE